MLRRTDLILVAAMGSLAVTSCASTSFKTAWKAPDAQARNYQGKKVVATVVSTNESVRRGAEAALARELTKRGVQGVAANTLIPSEELKDSDRAKARLQQAGIEGGVVLPPLGQRQELSYSAGTWTGPYYGGFYGYRGWGWGAVYDPGYLRSDTVFTVETLVYDVTQDKLLWAGMSETTSPSNLDKFIGEIVDEAAKEMRKQG